MGGLTPTGARAIAFEPPFNAPAEAPVDAPLDAQVDLPVDDPIEPPVDDIVPEVMPPEEDREARQAAWEASRLRRIEADYLRYQRRSRRSGYAIVGALFVAVVGVAGYIESEDEAVLLAATGAASYVAFGATIAMNITGFRAAGSLRSLGADVDRRAGTIGLGTSILFWPAGLPTGAIQLRRNDRAYERWSAERDSPPETPATFGLSPILTTEVRGVGVRLSF